MNYLARTRNKFDPNQFGITQIYHNGKNHRDHSVWQSHRTDPKSIYFPQNISIVLVWGDIANEVMSMINAGVHVYQLKGLFVDLSKYRLFKKSGFGKLKLIYAYNDQMNIVNPYIFLKN